MEKKYEMVDYTMTEECDGEMRKLRRIRALRDFGCVKKGELGGFIENEDNLSHAGNCWVYGNAKVYNNAVVSGNATVRHFAEIRNGAKVTGNAEVMGHSVVDSCIVGGRAVVLDYGILQGLGKGNK